MPNHRHTSISREQLELLASARESVVNDLASEIARLKAHIASVEAELNLYRATGSPLAGMLEERTRQLHADNVVLGENMANALSRLPNGENNFYARRVAELEEHNRLLTEAATERAQRVQDQEGQLTSLHTEIATLTPEVTRLNGENSFYARRLAELEEHNRLLTESATELARKLQEIRQTDYQLLMAHQQLLAGMKDAEPRFSEIYEKCRAYTMTSVERLYALYKSVEYIVSADIPGDFAETGVWQGGSCMLIAETLVALGERSRRIFLFDTFEGHPKPDAEKDVDLWGNRAIDEWQRVVGDDNHGKWAYVSLEDVQANLARTGYPPDRLVFVKGLLEQTVANTPAIGPLALMRLDTDWYASTKAGLEHLYPQLVSGGILIIDDYGHYKGQQQAVDEYFAAGCQPILLNRIDYSCRLGVKR